MTTTARPAGSRLGIILGFSALLFLAFAFGLRLVWFGAEAPLPPLLENLPDSKTEADQEIFLARLDRAFPAGFAESDLLDALAAQGFTRAAAPERVATYARGAGLNDKCRRSGNLRWSADAAGRVTKLTGGYYQHCPTH
ncbi:hypothetical protein [Methylocystis sp. JR02]|uniref:hypothetical protein n=1 Tax=Methylocystis sp. JR02 TaxID=3046284 RepID=UPI0024BB38A1|nr:hypothetical protein [Methylocystis sp. JR02]MDJ0448107.1 hypothetical protein [Methylocystis sp. JR02]